MDVVRFILKADPDSIERVGVMLDGGIRVMDLQAAHVSMRGAPSPHLRAATFNHAAAEVLVHEVVTWGLTQRPPGITALADMVRVLGPV